VTEAAAAADLVDATLHLSERLSKENSLEIRSIIPDLDQLEVKNDPRMEERNQNKSHGLRI
jgi:hypothetical protein